MEGYLNTAYIVNTNSTEEQLLILKTICQKLRLKQANKSDLELCQGLLGNSDAITDIPTASKYVLACLYVVTITASLIGNSLVVLSFVCHRHMRSTMNVFILSLAVSDFFVSVTCMPVNIVTAFSRYWVLGEFCCKLVPFMINTSFVLQVLGAGRVLLYWVLGEFCCKLVPFMINTSFVLQVLGAGRVLLYWVLGEFCCKLMPFMINTSFVLQVLGAGRVLLYWVLGEFCCKLMPFMINTSFVLQVLGAGRVLLYWVLGEFCCKLMPFMMNTSFVLQVLGAGRVLLYWVLGEFCCKLVPFMINSSFVLQVLGAGRVLLYWVLGEFCCKLVPFMINLTVASSSLTLCCIAIDRYFAIVHPLKRRFTKSPGFAAAFLTTVWLLAVASSTPYAYLYELSTVCGDETTATCDDVSHICIASDDGPADSLKTWMTFVVLLVIPFILVGAAYGRIVLQLWGRTPVGAVGARGAAADQQTRYKRKAIKMLVLVVLLYTFCWSPLLVFDIVSKETNLQASAVNFNIRYYLQWLALSGACYNPIIYAFMNEAFRKNFAKLLLCQRARVRVMPGETRRHGVNIVVENVSEPPACENHTERQTATETVTHI
ncbi:QRFP-like peptide receptor [Gigantopelta aegis]|uniref:QRFP-like peptide receptor n=1 Tax=Gigantopelta aegis TaxID=1735272 RepID=UPI001B889786|nr:QRFP-like peptide receptor [Gigantopelta aegis]